MAEYSECAAVIIAGVQDHHDRGGVFRPADQRVDGVPTVAREQVGGRSRHHLSSSGSLATSLVWSLTILNDTSPLLPSQFIFISATPQSL